MLARFARSGSQSHLLQKILDPPMVKSDALEITFAMTVEISTTSTSSSNTTTTMQYRPAVVVGIVVEKFVVVAKISVVASTF